MSQHNVENTELEAAVVVETVKIERCSIERSEPETTNKWNAKPPSDMRMKLHHVVYYKLKCFFKDKIRIKLNLNAETATKMQWLMNIWCNYPNSWLNLDPE